jgi:ferredoxin
MFRASLAHPQEALHKRHLVYCTRVQPTDIKREQCTKCRLCRASWGWASNVRNMQRSLILNKLNRKCITLVLFYWLQRQFSRTGLTKLWHAKILPRHAASTGVSKFLILRQTRVSVFWRVYVCMYVCMYKLIRQRRDCKWITFATK